MSLAILYDSSMCIGCRECEKACAARWQLPYNDAIAAEEQISAHKLTAIQTHGTRYSRRLCMHCADPTCASVCPVGAFKKTALGPVVYDQTKCIGCRYCMLACPFQVPAYEWSSRLPRVRKCDLCYERVSHGKPTACAEACPTGATTCGDRDAPIAEARRRLAEKPGQYYNRIYGIEEAGGTSVMFLSAVPFEQLGLKTGLPKEPLPPLTWRALSMVPDIASAGAVLLGGVWWITHRREEVAAAERGEGETLMADTVASWQSISAARARQMPLWTPVFWLLMAGGAYASWLRVSAGLGAVTNLSDQFPWGLWIGFDVLCGVGLAAGGFTLVAVVQIFNIKRYKPILRPAILTAFLGYLLVIMALMFDLGRPDRIWHPLVMWNPHSVMFEVAWCVMLYTTVLGLEFVPVVCERFGWRAPLRALRAISVPVVIAGVILSTLHQSSLGSLYLIVPQKLYPLWYTPLMPLLFYLSAISVGLAMTIFESWHSSREFGRSLELPLLSGMARLLAVLLSTYTALRLMDLYERGSLGLVLVPCQETYLWLLEMGLIIVPAVLLFRQRVRRSPGALYACSLMVVFGFIANRLNVSVTGMEAALHTHYTPKWSEITVTLAIVALGFAAFRLAAQRLPVFVEASQPRPKPG